MIESYQPRAARPARSAPVDRAAETTPQAASAAGTDPDQRARVDHRTSARTLTSSVDREYACIFELADAARLLERARTSANSTRATAPTRGLTADELPPSADPDERRHNQQLYAKAYPTIRELEARNKLWASRGSSRRSARSTSTDNATGRPALRVPPGGQRHREPAEGRAHEPVPAAARERRPHRHRAVPRPRDPPEPERQPDGGRRVQSAGRGADRPGRERPRSLPE